MSELLEHNTWLYRSHQNKLKNFLRSKRINMTTIDYDNVQLYSDVLSVIDNPLVHPKHVRQFRKFCRQWLRNHGALDPEYIGKIRNRCKYYHNKQYNAMMRERRLARKQKKTV